MRKTFNISDEGAVEKLKQVKNESKYVNDLIVKDIAGESDGSQFEAGVISAIKYIRKSLDMIEKTVSNNVGNNERAEE